MTEDQYPNLSLSMKTELSTTSVECMTMIGKLDKAAERLSRKLTQELETLKIADKIDMLEETATILRSLGEKEECELSPEQRQALALRRDFLQKLDQVNNMRKIIEIISAKKVEIAIKNYDFIDLNIKTIDSEISVLEKVMQASGHELHQLPLPLDSVSQLSITGKRRKGEDYISQVSQCAETHEPVYCVCKRIAFGEMIACDNEDCLVEWFHYPCVNLTRKPKNSWICHLCSNKKRK
jgi:hypothetical protein